MTNVEKLNDLANRFQTNLAYYKETRNNYNEHSLLKRIDVIVREDDDIDKALDIVDKEILIDGLGIDVEWCEKCRAIWRKMQRRRLGRG